MARQRDEVVALKEAWRREVEAARLYRALGDHEADPKRAGLFGRLAAAEEGHAERFGAKLAEMGHPLPDAPRSATPRERALVRLLGSEAMLRRMELEEERNIETFAAATSDDADPSVRRLFQEIEGEERAHSSVLRNLSTPAPSSRLESMLRHEKWHARTGSWIGDAIYGVNDGLGACFGIVSGMAGYSGGGHVVLIAGLAGAMASALSMGSGAYLATKSEREVHEAEMGRERREIEESPDHEREELELIYQLQGFTEDEARMMAHRMSENPEQFLKVMAQEELGLSTHTLPSPWVSTLSATLSTALGALVPVVPFFFTSGMPAVAASFIISTLAHFAVGAAKSLVTARSWLASGTEMTMVGVLEAAATYGLGLVLSVHGAP
ncbi:MAG TPA: VIT1/CCC1 transporter family protein [Armatimonadota bacterium]